MKSELDVIQSSENTGDPSLSIIIGKRGFTSFGLFGKMGIDISKLSDQQKTELDSYSKKMAELQKGNDK